MIELVLGLILLLMIVVSFIAGYCFASFTGAAPVRGKPPDENTILVKRNRASFRNPAQTSRTTYDEYKSSKGLYAPVKPGKGSMADAIDIKD